MCSTNTSALVLCKHNSNTLKLFYSSNRGSIDTQGFLSCTLVSVCPELMVPISVLVLPPAPQSFFLSLMKSSSFTLFTCDMKWLHTAILIFIIVLFFLRMIIMVPPPQIKSRKFNLGTMKIFLRKNIPYNKYATTHWEPGIPCFFKSKLPPI